MKVVCEYCGSYVEADVNMKCPLCQAQIGTAVQMEQQRVEQQEKEAYERELEEKAQESKDKHISEVISGITSVASAFVANNESQSTSYPQRPDDIPREPHGGRPPEPPDGRHGMPPEGRHGKPPENRGDHGEGAGGGAHSAGGHPGRPHQHHR